MSLLWQTVSSHVVSPTEIRYAVAEYVVGMIGVVGRTTYKVHYFFCRLARQSLPQAGREAAHHRCGKRSSHVSVDRAAARYYGRRTALCHHIGFCPSVLRRPYTAERGIHAFRCYRSYGDDVLRIGRKNDFFPRAHAAVSGARDEYHAFVGKHGR